MPSSAWRSGNDGTVVVVIYVNIKYLISTQLHVQCFALPVKSLNCYGLNRRSRWFSKIRNKKLDTHRYMTIAKMVCFLSRDHFNGSHGSAVGWGCRTASFFTITTPEDPASMPKAWFAASYLALAPSVFSLAFSETAVVMVSSSLVCSSQDLSWGHKNQHRRSELDWMPVAELVKSHHQRGIETVGQGSRSIISNIIVRPPSPSLDWSNPTLCISWERLLHQTRHAQCHGSNGVSPHPFNIAGCDAVYWWFASAPLVAGRWLLKSTSLVVKQRLEGSETRTWSANL